MTDALRAELDSRGKRYLVRAADGTFVAVNHPAGLGRDTGGDHILFDAAEALAGPYERVTIWDVSHGDGYYGWVAKFSDGTECDGRLWGQR